MFQCKKQVKMFTLTASLRESHATFYRFQCPFPEWGISLHAQLMPHRSVHSGIFSVSFWLPLFASMLFLFLLYYAHFGAANCTNVFAAL